MCRQQMSSPRIACIVGKMAMVLGAMGKMAKKQRQNARAKVHLQATRDAAQSTATLAAGQADVDTDVPDERAPSSSD